MINTIFEIAATFLDGLFLIWFIPSFLKTSVVKGKKPWCFILPVLLVVFQLLADIFLSGFDLIALAGGFIIVLLFSFSLLEWKRQKFGTVLVACLFVTVQMFSGSIVYSVFSLFINDLDGIMQGASGNARIIYVLTAVVFRFIVFKLILLVFKSNEGLDRKNGIFVLICFSLTAIGLGIVMYISSLSSAFAHVLRQSYPACLSYILP